MSLGVLKSVPNLKRKFGASPTYLFLKVQSGYGQEEYWLVTDGERKKFMDRAGTNPEDIFDNRRGWFIVVENQNRKFGTDPSYFAVRVKHEGELERWFMTTKELERVRLRTEDNAEDIEANRESWLTDLLD